jgi:uncharacterized repeat protein (TIGR01451 family)
VNLHHSPRRSSAPLGAESAPTRAAGLAPVTWARPIQRLFSRGASLTVAFVAAALLAACGGGGSDSAGTAVGDLSPRMAQIVGTTETPKSIEMKVLVISAEGTAPSYLATTSILDQIGVPYDKIVLSGVNKTTLQMGLGTLSDGAGNGKYQGIILESGDLPITVSPWNSAMTAVNWGILRQYQFNFGVRSATMYTRPAATNDAAGVPLDLTYGLTPVGARGTDDFTSPPQNAVTATFTAAGAGVFSYLNSANPVIVKNAYTYLSTPVPGTQTVPLLNATEGAGNYAIASTYAAPAGATTVGVAPGGWENLAISADNNPELTHTLLMGYGVVNWVTKGVFLGERKIYMSAQPDDVFIPDDLWNVNWTTATTGTASIADWRNNATDYASLIAWQTAFNANPKMAAFRLELPFNGVGYNTTDSAYLKSGPDTLSAAVRGNPNAFRWINHTWDHTSLNTTDPEDPGFVTPTVQSITNQLLFNHEVATGVRSGSPTTADAKVTFANYNKSAFIQPDISGLQNPVFWQAAQNFGLQYILMDTSKAYANFNPPRTVITNPDSSTVLSVISPNTGFTSSLDTFVPANPRIFIIPRYPTNLFYNVSTPAEWESEYDYIYGATGLYPAGFGYSDYPTLLSRQSDDLVRYMLKYNVNSWMFHAANLRDYDGPSPAGPNTKSLLSDLLDAVATKYSAMYSLPIVSPTQLEIGQIMQARMAYNAAIAGGLKGKIVYGPTVSIQLTNPSGVSVVVPMTGVNVGGTTYGGQSISTFPLAPGGTTTFAAPAQLTLQQSDLSVTIVSSTSTPVQGGTLTYSVVISNPGPLAATAASFSSTLQAGLGTITNVVSQASAGASTASFVTGPSSVSGLVSLPIGGQVTVTYRATVSPTVTGTLTTTATVTEPADRNDPNKLNNSIVQTVSTGPDVTSSVVLPANAIAGSVITGTVTFSNASVVTGGAAATVTGVAGTVTLSNGAVQSFAIGTLAPGASSVKSFTTTVPSTIGTTALSATSTVATTTPESNTTNNTGVATLTVLFADPGVLVSPIPAGNPGDTVTTNVTLSNSGAVAVTFTPEVIINGVSSMVPPVTLAPGASTSQAVAVLVTPNGATVTANVTAASVPDSNLANNSSTATLTFPSGGGGGGCTTNPDGKFDPLLWMMLLAGGVATGLRRRRAADVCSDPQ